MSLKIPLALICFGALGMPQPRPNAPFSFARDIGVATSAAGKICLGIGNPSLRPGASLRVVDPFPAQAESDARILNVDSSCPETDAGSGLTRYTVAAAPTGDSSVMSIAIAHFQGPFKKEGDLLTADLDGDGQQEFFRVCPSSEGLHFTVWSGKPLKGKLRWHQYFYLGYDVEPACTPVETEDPK